MMTTSLAALVSLVFVLGSLWMRRRAEGPDPQAHRYRQLGRMLALAALAVALFALWSVMEDHRRVSDAGPAGAPTARP
jgi:hypothetical protein